MGVAIKILIGIIILVVSSTTTHALERNLINGNIYFIAFVLSIFLFPLIAAIFCYPAYGLWLLGALIAKFFSNVGVHVIDQSPFQRKYGAIASIISQILWASALLYIIYDVVRFIFW
nr:MAG TPA: hypothetical protein [Caudoviricetes sp.]